MRLNRRMGMVVVTGLVAAAGLATVTAQAPPGPPDYYWPYGLVQANGANVAPAVQPVLAIVNGRVCGRGETLIATEGDNVPAGDVGKTVYKVDVLADGTRVDQQEGCGRPGDAVSLYFPLSGRIATQKPAFKQGGERVDLTLGPILQHRAIAPFSSRDGSQ